LRGLLDQLNRSINWIIFHGRLLGALVIEWATFVYELFWDYLSWRFIICLIVEWSAIINELLNRRRRWRGNVYFGFARCTNKGEEEHDQGKSEASTSSNE
jgi:hypothetical protein